MNNSKSNIFAGNKKSEDEYDSFEAYQIRSIFDQTGITDSKVRNKILKSFRKFKVYDLPSIPLKIFKYIYKEEEGEELYHISKRGKDDRVLFLLYFITCYQYDKGEYELSDFMDTLDKAQGHLDIIAINSAFDKDTIAEDQVREIYAFEVASTKYFEVFL